LRYRPRAGANSDTKVLVDYITVFSKPVLEFDITDESVEGAADGEILLTINDGTPPYNINWSNGMHTQTISGLTTGSYSVAVIDANGCMATGSATVNVYTGIATTNSKDINIYPNPVSEKLHINSNALIKSIAITDATGREINNITINTDNFEFETSGIVSGIYFICIELENGDLVIKKIIKQ